MGCLTKSAMVAVVLLFLAGTCFSIMAPPETIVNHQTKECSDFSGGDECTICRIPEGWVSLGYGDIGCPEGYDMVVAERECIPMRNSRCCSEGHSGSNGDCEDMVVNHLTSQCAFANESACATPEGWVKASDSGGSGLCPEGYAWVDDSCSANPLSCLCGPSAILALLVVSTFVVRRPIRR